MYIMVSLYSQKKPLFVLNEQCAASSYILLFMSWNEGLNSAVRKLWDCSLVPQPICVLSHCPVQPCQAACFAVIACRRGLLFHRRFKKSTGIPLLFNGDNSKSNWALDVNCSAPGLAQCPSMVAIKSNIVPRELVTTTGIVGVVLSLQEIYSVHWFIQC